MWTVNPQPAYPLGAGCPQGEFSILVFVPSLDSPWNTAMLNLERGVLPLGLDEGVSVVLLLQGVDLTDLQEDTTDFHRDLGESVAWQFKDNSGQIKDNSRIIQGHALGNLIDGYRKNEKNLI
jgi:hypothetical protein